MNPPLIPTTNANWRTGVTEKKKPVSYSLIYPNGVTVIANVSYALCKKLKQQHIHAVITPNFK